MAENGVVRVLGMLENSKRALNLVPEVGIEPTRSRRSLDFESSASTSFTTPALFYVFNN